MTFLFPYLLLFGGLPGAGMMSPQLTAPALHNPPAAEPRAFDCRKWSRSWSFCDATFFEEPSADDQRTRMNRYGSAGSPVAWQISA